MYSRSVESMYCRLRLYISVRSGVKCKGRYTPLLVSMHGQPHAQPASHRLKNICSGREYMLRISNNLNNVYAYLWQWTKKSHNHNSITQRHVYIHFTKCPIRGKLLSSPVTIHVTHPIECFT